MVEHNNKAKHVATIVVTYNRLELLKECLQSLRNQSYKDYSIIVVNNGSTDGTPKWLEEQKDLVVINQDNLGGAGGFFTGIKYASENGYDYSWVMDDDVVAEKDALEKLMLHAGITRGFLCSRIIGLNGEQCNVPLISKVRSVETNELLWGEKLDEMLLRLERTSFVSVLIPTSTSRELGLPYKEYFIWGDDAEYTDRINQNYPSYMVIDSKVVHKRKIQRTISIFTETDKKRQKMFYYWYRNRIHFQKTLLGKVIFFVYSHYEALCLLSHGKLWQMNAIIKGTWASLFFHPQIKYPNA